MHRDHPFRIFAGSGIVTVIALVIALLYGGWEAVILAGLLGVMEVSLSFDNAVVNARILEKLSEKWQRIFLTVGVLIAVFGMRLFFPLAIVSLVTGLNPWEAFLLAEQRGDPATPGTYGYILHEAHPQIAAFGGLFLLMIFLDFIFEQRDLHWLGWLEKPLQKLGQLPHASIIVALGGLLAVAGLAHEHTVTVMVSGVAGLITYLLVSALGEFFENKLESEDENAPHLPVKKLTGQAAFFSFLYLEVLDASFSFDGVIGAFAITVDPIIIALGLGLIGAMFVRSITIFLVRKGTLDEFVFLDHGAHWAIGALAVILVGSIAVEVPEVVTGLIGVALIIAAFISSVRYNKKNGGHSLMEAVDDTMNAETK